MNPTPRKQLSKAGRFILNALWIYAIVASPTLYLIAALDPSSAEVELGIKPTVLFIIGAIGIGLFFWAVRLNALGMGYLVEAEQGLWLNEHPFLNILSLVVLCACVYWMANNWCWKTKIAVLICSCVVVSQVFWSITFTRIF